LGLQNTTESVARRGGYADRGRLRDRTNDATYLVLGKAVRVDKRSPCGHGCIVSTATDRANCHQVYLMT
ncbi:hypothetical protein RZS08_04275, partial [Arthrospira platensis SPKY1]|nr:hypothetical protein [Arthrospira platensis SPKY1]